MQTYATYEEVLYCGHEHLFEKTMEGLVSGVWFPIGNLRVVVVYSLKSVALLTDCAVIPTVIQVSVVILNHWTHRSKEATRTRSIKGVYGEAFVEPIEGVISIRAFVEMSDRTVCLG